jgi:hypothetical protein
MADVNYGRLAELVVVLHFCFVLFVLFGGALALRWPKVVWLHLPAAAWGALISFAGWVCPLTPLEKWLRRQGGSAGYEGGFVEHYILPVLYPRALTRDVQILLGVIVILLNLYVYWRVYRRLHSLPRGTS